MSGTELGSHHGHLVLYTVRQLHFYDAGALVATEVTSSAFVAARDEHGALLLVRRCDSGSWELPGGRVEVGVSVCGAGVRETAEEADVQVHITGLVGLFTEPGHVVVAPGAARRDNSSWCACTPGRPGAGRGRTDGRRVPPPGSTRRPSMPCPWSRGRPAGSGMRSPARPNPTWTSAYTPETHPRDNHEQEG
jgi:8-oxo-dGTP pyrophosphatase MutT (NUDIX family)